MRKIKDSNEYDDIYISIVKDIEQEMSNGLSYVEARDIMYNRGLVNSEFGDVGDYGYAIFAYEDDPDFGYYGNANTGVYVEYEWLPNQRGTGVVAGDVVGCELFGMSAYNNVSDSHKVKDDKKAGKFGVEFRNMHNGIHGIVVTNTEEKAEKILEYLNELDFGVSETDEEFLWEDINSLATYLIEEVDYRDTEASNGIYEGIEIINYGRVKPDIYM